jgi:hypothetical protein
VLVAQSYTIHVSLVGTAFARSGWIASTTAWLGNGQQLDGYVFPGGVSIAWQGQGNPVDVWFFFGTDSSFDYYHNPQRTLLPPYDYGIITTPGTYNIWGVEQLPNGDRHYSHAYFWVQ